VSGEKKSLREVLIAGGFTPKVLITWIILHILIYTIANIWGQGVVRTHTYITATRVGIPTYPQWGWFYLLLIFIVPLSIAMKRNVFSKQELAVLFALQLFSLDTAIMMDPVVSYMLYSNVVEELRQLATVSPSFWGITDEALVSPSYAGGAGGMIPWGAIGGAMAFWILFVLVYWLFNIFLMEIFRRRFIEVEKLPYPAMLPVTMLINYSIMESPEKKPLLFNFKENKFFYLGFILGLLYAIPIIATYLWPELGIPAFYCAGRFPIYPLASFFATNPFHIVGDSRFVLCDFLVLYLLPMDVLRTLVLWQIIAFVIWPIIGSVTGIMAPGVSGWAYLRVSGPFRPLAFSNYSLLGLGVGVIVLNLKYIIDYINKSIKRESVPVEDVPYHWGFYGFIVAAILYFCIGLALGVPIAIMIVIFILHILLNVGYSYFIGEGWGIGYVMQDCFTLFDITRQAGIAFGYWSTKATLTRESWATGAFIAAQETFGFGRQCANGPWAPMANYRIAKDTDTSPRSMFIAMLFGALVISIISVPIAVWCCYEWGVMTKLTWYGPKGLALGWAYKAYLSKGVLTDYSPFSLNDATAWGHLIAAIIIIPLLMYLRTIFPWFWIHPVGIITTYVFRHLTEGLPVLVLKWLTLKVGGARAYEKVGVPLVAGALVGLTFGVSLGMMILYARSIM